MLSISLSSFHLGHIRWNVLASGFWHNEKLSDVSSMCFDNIFQKSTFFGIVRFLPKNFIRKSDHLFFLGFTLSKYFLENFPRVLDEIQRSAWHVILFLKLFSTERTASWVILGLFQLKCKFLRIILFAAVIRALIK